MNYLNWLRKTYPELNEISNETINSHIDKAKSDTELFREFIKVLGSLFFIIPFNLYLYISGIQESNSSLYWLLVVGCGFNCCWWFYRALLRAKGH